MSLRGTDVAMDLGSLRDAYRAGVCVADVVLATLRRIHECDHPGVWISLHTEADLMRRAGELDAMRSRDPSVVERQPLFGVPFGVKDNIDVAGLATTAACPAFAYTPTPGSSAFVVERLEAAGAVCIGKTNLDQFATGLVGVRSPYGVCPNAFDRRYIGGGSSSGSGVAVALGQVAFALGTDTAGSGRVPAAFNNIVGLKPSRGVLSNRGMIPACRSLDCMSIFAGIAEDAAAVLRVAAAYDEEDPYSHEPHFNACLQTLSPSKGGLADLAEFRFGVPDESNLTFFGDDDAAALYAAAVARIESLGGTKVVIDFEPFRRAGQLLYQGPWVCERAAGVGSFIADYPDAVLPVIREIVGKANQYSGVDAFTAMHTIDDCRRAAAKQWRAMDVLLLPTTPTIYTIEQIEADPIALNARLGTYTQFVNLLDCSAIAVPAGFRSDGLPLGVTLIAPAMRDMALCVLGAKLHRAAGVPLGATGRSLPPPVEAVAVASPHRLRIAVVGAHLHGQPLNHQLTSRGARLVATTTTAAAYRLYALANTTPPKPGLIRDADGQGAAIEVEVWDLPADQFGSFLALVPPPLCIGTIDLCNGMHVHGFLCEPHVLADATDITAFGGWRAYLASR